jgi:hypothetical protein
MFTFSIQCFNPTKNENILNTQFCVLSKGLNSGKPLEKPGQNCFIITASNPEQKEFLFWLCWGLWQSNKFHYLLTGSVIPFIRLSEFKTFIKQQAALAINAKLQYQKSINTLQQLQALENSYKQNLQLIQKAKKMVFHSFVIKQ